MERKAGIRLIIHLMGRSRSNSTTSTSSKGSGSTQSASGQSNLSHDDRGRESLGQNKGEKPARLVRPPVIVQPGIYIAPWKKALLKGDAQGSQESPQVLQRQSWEQLRKAINGLVNKVNTSNIKTLIPDLLQLNLVRGRGLLVRAIMKAQQASPGYTAVYASIVAVINTKLPEIGELHLRRVVAGFKKSYSRRDKLATLALVKFVAHLVNQAVAHELLALQLLSVLLEEPTDDSVEIATDFVKEVGQILEEVSRSAEFRPRSS